VSEWTGERRLADGALLVLPAVHRYREAVHAVTALVAADLGFDTAAVDDLRLATDQVATLLVAAAPTVGALEVRFRADAEDLYVGLSVHGLQPEDPPTRSLVRDELLAATVDSIEVSTHDDVVEAVLQRSLPS
jgi:hypothetical protein